MHKIAEKKWSEGIFKAYDIRGRYPEEINEDAAYKIARAFARYVRLGVRDERLIKIVVSADARKSSPVLKEAFLDGLLGENVEIIDAGLTTTPMHYFVVNKTEADGGAMITASHNPSEFNGVKLCKKGAVPIGMGAGMEEIRNDAVRGIFTVAKPMVDHERKEEPHPLTPSPSMGRGRGEGLSYHDFLDEYIKFFEAKFSELNAYSIKLTACLGNGMTSMVLPKLFKKFSKFKVKLLHDDLDMTFPNHEADPLKAKNLEDVKLEVRSGRLDIGVSFDGDGDRVGFVDEKGNVVRGDIMTALLVRYFAKAKGAGNENSRWGRAVPQYNPDILAIIYDLRSSRTVREEIEKSGMRPLESCVGHAFIKALMRKENAVFGGEISGHYYFRDFFYADSAIFAMLAVLDLMRIENKPLSELAAPLLRYAKSDELNYEVKDKEAAMDKVAAYFKNEKISYLDGVKIEHWDGVSEKERWWFNLRQSNTEDLIRLNLEASTPALLKQKKKLIEELLRK